MKALTPEQRRGLRMAAQVACALSLLAAGTGTSLAKGQPATTVGEPAGDKSSSFERTADVLRIGPNSGGGCVPSWGPSAPCEVSSPLFASFVLGEEAA